MLDTAPAHPATRRSATPSARLVARARWAVMASFAVNGFLFATWVSRIPTLRDQLDLSTSRLGLLLLAGSMGSVLMLPLAGSVVLRLGTRRTVTAFGLLCTVGVTALGLGAAAGSVPLVALALIATGVCIGAWDVAMNIEGAAVERQLGRTVMPQYHAGFSLGAVAGSAVGALAAGVGLSLVVHLAVVAALGAVVVVATARPFLPSALSGATARPARSGSRGGAFAAWREPRTLLIGLLVLSAALTEGSANDWLALGVVDGLGRSEAVGAATFALFVACMTAVRLWGTRLLDRYGRVAVLRVSAAVSLAGLLLFSLAPSYELAVLGVVAWGAGAALGFPVGMSAAADDPVRAAVRVSVVSSIGYVAFLAGPPLLGLAADTIGIRHALLLIGLPLVASVLLASVARPLRPAQRAVEDAGVAELQPAPC